MILVEVSDSGINCVNLGSGKFFTKVCYDIAVADAVWVRQYMLDCSLI